MKIFHCRCYHLLNSFKKKWLQFTNYDKITQVKLKTFSFNLIVFFIKKLFINHTWGRIRRNPFTFSTIFSSTLRFSFETLILNTQKTRKKSKKDSKINRKNRKKNLLCRLKYQPSSTTNFVLMNLACVVNFKTCRRLHFI